MAAYRFYCRCGAVFQHQSRLASHIQAMPHQGKVIAHDPVPESEWLDIRRAEAARP